MKPPSTYLAQGTTGRALCRAKGSSGAASARQTPETLTPSLAHGSALVASQNGESGPVVKSEVQPSAERAATRLADSPQPSSDLVTRVPHRAGPKRATALEAGGAGERHREGEQSIVNVHVRRGVRLVVFQDGDGVCAQGARGRDEARKQASEGWEELVLEGTIEPLQHSGHLLHPGLANLILAGLGRGEAAALRLGHRDDSVALVSAEQWRLCNVDIQALLAGPPDDFYQRAVSKRETSRFWHVGCCVSAEK
eukprot:scaffold2774_cov137-Isochrysis_galbana.AAC.3